MTREELEHAANELIAAAKATAEQQGCFAVTILIHAEERWQRLPFPQELVPLMNNGQAKDAIFGALRQTIQQTGADAVIVGSDSWHAQTTPEGKKHFNTPEWDELIDFGYCKLVERGWVIRREVFLISAQNVNEVLILQQPYERIDSGRIQLLDSTRNWVAQSDFTGRQKMFGDLKWENLGSEAAIRARHHD